MLVTGPTLGDVRSSRDRDRWRLDDGVNQSGDESKYAKMVRYYVLVLGGWMDGWVHGWRQCWSLDQKLGVAAAAGWHESRGRKEEMERSEPDGRKAGGCEDTDGQAGQ